MASHAGVRIDEDVYEKIMHDSGCANTYFALEECLAESGRNWTICQEALRSWKTCMADVKARHDVPGGAGASPALGAHQSVPK